MNRFAKIQAVNSNTGNHNLHLTKVGEERGTICSTIPQLRVKTVSARSFKLKI